MAQVSLKATFYYYQPWMKASTMRTWQTRRLKKILTHAYIHFSLYREKYQRAGVTPQDFHSLEDLRKFPTVSKDEVIRYFSSVEANGLIESFSSGSSGKILRVLHNPRDTVAYILGRARILNITKALSPFSRTLYIYTSPFPASSFFGLYKSFFIQTITPIDEIVTYIRQVRPHIISAYPSHMTEMAKHLGKEACAHLSLRFISVGSELSTPSERHMLEEYFNCPVLDEYSSEELGWIASECPKKNYHLWEDISYIEIENGEIIGTNLHNFSMPFIRYRQGDTAHFKEEICTCGRMSRTLEKIDGRQNDAFVFSDGSTLSSGYLLDAFYTILLTSRLPILDFRLIQTSRESVRLELVSKEQLRGTDITMIERKLMELLPSGIHSEVTFPAILSRSASGKRNPIIGLTH